MKNIKRCQWPGADSLMIKYHDKEWGTPLHNDRKLFEFLMLEGFQAGLSWQTILNKRANFKKAFDNFDALKISKYTQRDINRLFKNAGIIRNRLKIQATIGNAKAYLAIKKEYKSFDKYIWQFVNHKPIKNKFTNISQIPAKTAISDKMSVDLKARGFKFVGSTICYAFMQAAGLINDHTVDCFRYREVSKSP